MQIEELRLDGNAAGGILREVFAHEMTNALARCVGCGSEARIAELLEYGHPMGVVLRCPNCDTAELRIVRTPTFYCVDIAGVQMLTIPESVSPATGA
ncbi:MAG: DUF6510 family protein [Gemmatimonadota bacterium]